MTPETRAIIEKEAEEKYGLKDPIKHMKK